ncbi:hypothetical protein LZ30DRAFT_227348 [Colletotrichum cereale]|nr:hypothetical protein LZ30DRAFT_227348 [Colletotrichum cereale]
MQIQKMGAADKNSGRAARSLLRVGMQGWTAQAAAYLTDGITLTLHRSSAPRSLHLDHIRSSVYLVTLHTTWMWPTDRQGRMMRRVMENEVAKERNFEAIRFSRAVRMISLMFVSFPSCKLACQVPKLVAEALSHSACFIRNQLRYCLSCSFQPPYSIST